MDIHLLILKGKKKTEVWNSYGVKLVKIPMNKQAGSLIELISDEQNYQCKNITATTYLQKETDNHEDKLSNEGNFQSEM